MENQISNSLTETEDLHRLYGLIQVYKRKQRIYIGNLTTEQRQEHELSLVGLFSSLEELRYEFGELFERAESQVNEFGEIHRQSENITDEFYDSLFIAEVFCDSEAENLLDVIDDWETAKYEN